MTLVAGTAFPNLDAAAPMFHHGAGMFRVLSSIKAPTYFIFHSMEDME